MSPSEETPAPPESGAPEEDVTALQKELEQLKAQLEDSQSKGQEMMERLKETHDRMLRTAADLDNHKKRSAKEREDAVKYGSEKLLKDFLPVIDNFQRALEHAKGPADFEALKQGLVMTQKLFEDTLARHGVKSFSSKGEPFDPHRHEAMQQVESGEVPAHHVAQEVVRGYTLHDRLLRPALVVVSTGSPGGEKKE